MIYFVSVTTVTYTVNAEYVVGRVRCVKATVRDVRVRVFAPKKVWKKRYGHIANFEQMLVDLSFIHIFDPRDRQNSPMPSFA